MNIIFFVEPAIELGNPVFRYASLKNSLLPQIKALRSNGHEIITIISETIAQKCVENNIINDIGRIAVIDPLEWTNGEGYLPRSIRHQKKEYNVGEVESVKSMLNSAINDSEFFPDVIIVWESPAYYLEDIYPCSKIVYQMPGVFSRPPYANMVSFHSHLLTNHIHSVNYKPSDEENSAFSLLREEDARFLDSISPTKKIINNIKNEFSKIILLPLQIDDYFMISSPLGEDVSQFDMLTNLLRDLPENVALLVTNYISRDTQSSVLSDESISYLRRRYKNFKYYEETNDIPWVSQYLVKDVDGVVTISSSLGYQSVYWGKPLYIIGSSHLSGFSSAKSISDFLEQVNDDGNYYQDDKLIELLSFKNIPQDYILKNDYSEWLLKAISCDFSHKWTGNVGQELISRRREVDLLNSLKPYKEKYSVHDDFHCNELSQQLTRYEVISFDIFDTLLMRPFRHPTELYDFIEPQVKELTGIPHLNFKNERCAAEKIAFKTAIETGLGEVTLREIYYELAIRLDLDENIRDEVMQIEMQTEYDFLYPRKSGYRAYLEAKQLGKRVIFVSDMYLPAKFLGEVLNKNGYNEYEKLYVSSEHRLKKHSGELFDFVLDDLGVEPSTILHVGDNIDADVKKAKLKGIKPFHLKKSYDEFMGSSDYKFPWSRDEARHSLDWRMLLSIAGNHLHDNPYIPFRKNTLFGGSPIKLGYYGMGALLLGYVKWVIENAINDKIERLYFLSRDGKVMKKAYDLVAKLYNNAPSSHYLLCSRRAVNLAKVKTQHDIIELATVDYANNVKLAHLLYNRFGIDIDNVPDGKLHKYGFSKASKLPANDKEGLISLLIDIKEDIFAIAEAERNLYLQYLDESGVFSEGNVSIVDIGYAGTMQQSLHQLSQNKKKIGGYYLITFRTALKRVSENGLNVRGFLAEFIDRHDTYHSFCRHVPLYETLFSCSDTTFVRMSKDWNGNLCPIFMPSSPVEKVRTRVVEDIQRGAISYVSEVISILGASLKKLDIEPNKSLRILDLYFNNPHPRDARILSGVMFEDAYGGSQFKTILPLMDEISDDCIWRQGKEVLMADVKSANPSVSKLTSPMKYGNHKNEKSNSSFKLHSGSYIKRKLVFLIMTRCLTLKKRNKFINKPEEFFSDSNSNFIRIIGDNYLR